MDMTEGRWALVRNWSGRFDPDIRRMDVVTVKQVRTYTASRDRLTRREDVMATFPSKEEASDAQQKIAGIAGERKRRITAAVAATDKQLDNLLSRFNGDSE